MHPGNLFLRENGDIAVVDFGIMGKIDRKTRADSLEATISSRCSPTGLANILPPSQGLAAKPHWLYACACRTLRTSVLMAQRGLSTWRAECAQRWRRSWHCCQPLGCTLHTNFLARLISCSVQSRAGQRRARCSDPPVRGHRTRTRSMTTRTWHSCGASSASALPSCPATTCGRCCDAPSWASEAPSSG